MLPAKIKERKRRAYEANSIKNNILANGDGNGNEKTPVAVYYDTSRSSLYADL